MAPRQRWLAMARKRLKNLDSRSKWLGLRAANPQDLGDLNPSPSPNGRGALGRAGGVERVHIGGCQRKLGCAHKAFGLFERGGAGDRRGDAGPRHAQASATSAGLAWWLAATSASSASRMRNPVG